MGRPRINEPRSKQLNLSFTVSELENIAVRARALGMRAADFGRSRLLATDGIEIAPSDREKIVAIRLLHNQLMRLGNNLNQMVRHLHITGDPLPADLEPLLTDIRRLIEKMTP